MTVPFERLRAIAYTRTFLCALLDPKARPRIPKDVRAEARRLLKHYPADCGLVYQDELTKWRRS